MLISTFTSMTHTDVTCAVSARYLQAYKERDDSISDVTSSQDLEPVQGPGDPGEEAIRAISRANSRELSISRANSREFARVPSREQDLLSENSHVITRIRPSGSKRRTYWPICGG